MPAAVRLVSRPDDDTYEAVLGAFGLARESLLGEELYDLTQARASLRALAPKLRPFFSPRDVPRVLPDVWDRRACLRVLRLFLRTRDVALKSRVVRSRVAADHRFRGGGDGQVRRVYQFETLAQNSRRCVATRCGAPVGAKNSSEGQ